MEYKYELKYVCNDYSSIVKFDADVDIETLRANLRYFLASCSWTSQQLDDLLGADE